MLKRNTNKNKKETKKKTLTIKEMRAKIDSASLPKHIAIIMDGNGRWALRRGLPRIAGHKKGADAVRRVSKHCRELGVPVLTLYAFSDENWGRPKDEVTFLMQMLESYLRSEIDKMKKNNITFRTIGRMEKLPLSTQELIRHAIAETAGNAGMVLNLALSYGGRGEIIEAIRRMYSSNGSVQTVTEESFVTYLDTAGLPDPDLIIRTSGEKRVSNFLLWQIAYAELYFSDKLWPDYTKEDLYTAILDYQHRERRFGRISEQISD